MSIPTEIASAPELRPDGHHDRQWVEYLQRLLITSDIPQNRSVEIEVDGDYGRTTQTAVRNFQQFLGVEQTGIVDGTTWAGLYRDAHRSEEVAEIMGDFVGYENAERQRGKLEPGHEIGRNGWRCCDVTFVVKDFVGQLVQGGQLYARFIAADNATSDEFSTISDGMATLHQVWIPAQGLRVAVYVSFDQFQLEGHPRSGFDIADDILSFDVEQEFEERVVTVSEALMHGWMEQSQIGAKVSSGFDFKVAKLGSEVTSTDTSGTSGSETFGETEQVKVRTATNRLKIDRTG